MTGNRTKARSRWLCSAAFAVSMLGTAVVAQEVPTGGSVAAGSAAITQGTGALTVKQASSRAVIDWKSFGIGAGGHVTVEQPGAGSALLNRVTGGDVSTIAGSLTSNGQVFLINRNGIVVTPTGTIDTRGGFVGSTLDITNDDFMAGRLRFAGSGAGSILNRGRIAGGAIALLAANVSNEGLIVSPLGRVALGSGQQATLDLSGDGFLQVALPAGTTDANGTPLVSSSGRIDASVVVLKAATAREAVRQAVNMSGVIRATSVSGDGGAVVLDGGAVVLDGGAGGLVRVGGTVDVTGVNGGRIDVTGQSVAVEGGSLLASGATRGGLVRLGGAFQGGAAQTDDNRAEWARFHDGFGTLDTLASADVTSLDAASTIDVSGGAAGGAAVLWSTLSTTQLGSISAAAGGAVEVSSKGRLSFALPRVTAGTGGLVLLDPKNIEVDDDAFAAGAIALPGSSVAYADPGSDPATTVFKAGDILALMNAGTNVILRASNDITWNTYTNSSVDFSYASSGKAGDLTLSAGRSVLLSGYLTLYSSNFSVIANDTLANGVVNADRDAGNAQIDALNFVVSGQVAGSQTPGNISFKIGTGAGLTNRGFAPIDRLSSMAGGNITLDTSGQNITWRLFPTQGAGTALDPVTITGKGAVDLSGNLSVQTSGGLAASGTTVTWVDEAIRSIAGNSVDAPITFVENGVTTRYGITAGTQNLTRVSLGKGSAYTTIAYGDAVPAPAQLRVTSGALRGGDTLQSIAADLSLSTTGVPAANSAPGDYNVLTSATPDANGTVIGYFFNLTGASDLLRITPKLLTPTIAPGTYTYGSPTAVVSLAGVINSDVVAPVATLDAATGTVMAANGAGFGFAANTAAGSHSFTLTGLGGANAGNYALDLSGTTSGALSIARKALTYQILDATTTYGTLATPVALLNGGVLGGDVVNLANIVSAGLSTTANVGAYALSGNGLSGAAASNYELAASGNIDATLTIDRKALTYAATGGSTTYGSPLTLATPTLTGVINGDQVSATPLLSTGATSVTPTTQAGTYGVIASLTGVGAGNYTIAATGNVDGVVTVARKPVTFAVNDATAVYGSPAAVLTLNGLTGLDGTFPVMQADGSSVSLVSIGATTYGFNANAGSHSFIFNGLQGSGAANYMLDLGAATQTGDYTVSPKALTYAIDSTSQTFRTAVGAPTVTLGGVVGADNVSGNGLTANGNAVGDPTTGFFALNAGSYTLAISGLSGTAAGNYILASTGNTPGLRTVTPATVTYAFGATASSVYGTTATLPFAALNNTYFLDDVHPVVTVSQNGAPVALGDRTPVGTYGLSVTSLTGVNATNYVLATSGNATSQLVISQKPISYSIGNQSIVYGQPLALAATLSGVIAGDTVSGVVGSSNGVPGGPVGAFPAIVPAGSSPYNLALSSLTGADAGNYSIATTGNGLGQLTVTPKPITYQVASSSWVYADGQIVPGAVTLNGVINNDYVFVNPVLTTSSNGTGYTGNLFGLTVGTYTQSVTGIDGLGNYTLAPTGNSNGTLTITPKSIAAFVNLLVPSSNTYGLLQPGQTFASANIFGLLATNVSAVITPSVQTASAGGKLRVGTYSFTATGITGPDAFNYSFGGGNTASFTVTPKILSSAVTNVATIYGTVPTISIPALSGIVAGDAVSGGGFTITSASTGAPVTLAPQTPAGSYYVAVASLTGADASNYSAGAGTGTITINRKAITAAGAASTSTYGTLATLTAPVLAGLVGDDQVSGVYSNILNEQAGSGLAFYDRTHVGTYRTTVNGLTGAAAGNYILSSATPGSLVIAPRTIGYTLDYTSATGIYGTTFASPLQLQGVLAGDSVSTSVFGRLTAKPANRGDAIGTSYTIGFPLDVGTYSLGADLRGNGLALGGISASDYVAPVTGLAAGATTLPLATVGVTPRAVTYGLTNAASVAYGTAPTATLTLNTAQPGGPLPDYTLIATSGGASVDLGRNATNDRVVPGAYTVAPLLIGSSAYDFTLTGNATPLTVTPKLLTLALGITSVIYGDALANLLTLPGVLTGDAVAPVANFGGTAITTTVGAAGYGLGTVTMDAGARAFTVSSLAGAQAGNYALSNAGLSGLLNVTPRTLTYSVDSVSGLYGGVSASPVFAKTVCSGEEYCALATTPGFTTGAVTFGNILQADRSQVSGTVVLNDGARTFGYAINTPVGNYLEVVAGLQGAKAGNYTLASTGNTAGVMSIGQAWIEATISGGGRLYNSGDPTDYVSLGTPGIATILRSFGNVQGRNPTTQIDGFVPGDDVGVVVSIFKDGAPYSGGGAFPVGDYEFRPVGLSGAQASNYRLIPRGGLPNAPNQVGSSSGTFTVSDSSIFGFNFLTNTPSAAYTPPASVTTFTPSITVTGSAQGSGSAGTVQTATSFVATASGQGSVQGSVSVGPASLSAYAGGGVQTLASFGVTGVNLSASAQAGASVTLAVGPASITYSGAASASATATLGLTGLVLQSNADASLSSQLAIGGDLGSGVSGATSTTATVFASASNTSSASFSNGTLNIGQRSYVGVGGTINSTGTISGGGFSGSAGITLYSPGSLGVGASSTSGYSDGVVTIGFSLGISLGIGGLEISPSFSFDTGKIKDGATGIGNVVVDVFTGNAFKDKPTQAYCDSACTTAKAAAETQTKYDVAAKMMKDAGGKPTLELMSYLAANPDVEQLADASRDGGKNFTTAYSLARAIDSYGAVPQQLNDVIAQEQTLTKRLQSNPSSLSVADLQLAASLRRDEANLLGKAADLGGKIVVANGSISIMANTASASAATPSATTQQTGRPTVTAGVRQ